MTDLDRNRVAEALGRRSFLSRTALTAGALGTLAALDTQPVMAQAPGAGSATPEAIVNDVNILNFALNLEYLEAEFYLRAAFGTGLGSNDTTGPGDAAGRNDKPGAVTGGHKVPFKTKAFRNYAVEIAEDERNHVRFLRKTLGKSAVSRPRIDLKTSFTTAARAAGLIKSGQTFDPFANETNFLIAAFIFEDVGVTAYNGAAPLIQNKAYLAAAASILAVEAYHAGEIRTILYSQGLYKPAQAISDLRDKADHDGDQDQGIGNSSTANIIPTDSNGLAYARTVDQVLRIVYLGNSAHGGFFPTGLNGSIDR